MPPSTDEETEAIKDQKYLEPKNILSIMQILNLIRRIIIKGHLVLCSGQAVCAVRLGKHAVPVMW